MIKKYNNFLRKLNEEAAPKIPNSESYWVDKKGKRGKDVMIYTHDDLDGIFSGIAIKKYLKDKGFNIIGYGLITYQDGWDVLNVNKDIINVAVDFTEPHPDIDIYIDHHGEFVEGDKIADEAIKKGAIKTDTGSAYEGIMDQLGLPVDSLVLDVIDMVDSAKYDEYGVKWEDLLDFDIKEIKKKPNAKLLFAGAFNQMLKRGDFKTIIEVIHNVDEPSIYKIFNYMKKLYPENNPWIRRGVKEEDLSDEKLKKFNNKDFIKDSKWRLNTMQKKSRGSVSDYKKSINSLKEFTDYFSVTDVYNTPDGVKSFPTIYTEGYCIIGELAYFGPGLWVNPARANAILKQDIKNGFISEEDASKIKWILLQYDDTLQMVYFGDDLKSVDEDKLPKTKDGSPVNNLDKFNRNILSNFKNKLNFNNQETKAGGHVGIGSITKIGYSSFQLPPDGNPNFDFTGILYLDIFKNYIISVLSKIPWSLKLRWTSPVVKSPSKPILETPLDARVMYINQIRTVDSKSGKIEYPVDYERKLSLPALQRNAAKLKQLDDTIDDKPIIKDDKLDDEPIEVSEKLTSYRKIKNN